MLPPSSEAIIINKTFDFVTEFACARTMYIINYGPFDDNRVKKVRLRL
jgi:hypothetical protein